MKPLNTKIVILKYKLREALADAERNKRNAKMLEKKIRLLEDTSDILKNAKKGLYNNLSSDARLNISKMMIKQNEGSYYCDTINDGHSLKPMYLQRNRAVINTLKMLSDNQKEYPSSQYTQGSFTLDKKNWKVIRYIFNTAKDK